MGLSVWSTETARVPTVRGTLRMPKVGGPDLVGGATRGFLRKYPMSRSLS